MVTIVIKQCLLWVVDIFTNGFSIFYSFLFELCDCILCASLNKLALLLVYDQHLTKETTVYFKMAVTTLYHRITGMNHQFLIT